MINKKTDYDQFLEKEEIDFSNILKILLLRKKLIGFTTIIFIFFGYVFFKTRIPQWQGQFDIVLRSNNSSIQNLNPLENLNGSVLSQFVSQYNSGLDLKTEVQILNSQSVLMPVFDFFKDENKKNGIDVSSLSFNSWRNRLKIDLERGTSILNIQYLESDKKIIKPVLEMISSEYKKYSGKDRDKGLKNGIDYLENQKIKLTKESQISIKKLQKFSLENNLGNFDGLLAVSKSTGIGKVKTDEDKKQTKNITSRYDANFEKLYKLESMLIQKSTILKPNAPQIKSLETQIETLKENLSRPSKILIDYRNLQREALRNEELLINIEGQLETLKLELARIQVPWELISEPSVTNNPVYPEIEKILILSILLGFGISSIYVILNYKRLEIVDNFDEFEKIIPFDFIKTFYLKKNTQWKKSVELIKEVFTINNKDNFGILFLSSLDSQNFDDIINLFEMKNLIYSSSENLISLKSCNKILLVAESGLTNRKELDFILEDIKLINKNILGWIYIG